MNMKSAQPIKDIDAYLASLIEDLFVMGEPLSSINAEFDVHDISAADRDRLILNSSFSKDPEISGTLSLFGGRL